MNNALMWYLEDSTAAVRWQDSCGQLNQIGTQNVG